MVKKIYLCRHGETEWSQNGKHTGLTDIALTADGEAQAKSLKGRLTQDTYAEIWSSPLKRAKMTCNLAGFSDPKIVDDLVEWNYGKYEGLTTEEIRTKVPDWTIFRYGAEQGESVEDVGKRANRVIDSAKQVQGNLIIFSHGHFSRVLGATWLGLSASDGRFFVLSTAALSILSYERDQPVIQCWNDNSYLPK